MVVRWNHAILFDGSQHMERRVKNNIKYTHSVLLWLEELHKILKEELLLFFRLNSKNIFFTAVIVSQLVAKKPP